MNIALYTRQPDANGVQFFASVIRFLSQKNDRICVYRPIIPHLPEECRNAIEGEFENQEELIGAKADFLFSIGGDGTFIDAANIVGSSNIPILGINTGRIGFLTNINRQNFEEAYKYLKTADYQLEKRILLHVESDDEKVFPAHFALNDISVHPSGESINAIQVWADGEKVNTYWGDGVIVTTPTGSTAYSLSCGGPILVPTAEVIVITPIASHSLTVRPIVLPANCKIKLKVESRSREFVLAMDSHRITISDSTTLTITQERFTIQTIRLPNADFYSVIREKLLWGLDKRNNSN